MQKIILLLIGLFIFGGCAEGDKEMGYPEDLAGKKKLLQATKAEVKEANALIAKLKEEIAVLDPNKREKPKALVTTQDLEIKDFKRFTEIQASVQADDPVSASSETGGRILEQKWQEGDYIKRGDLVARIDLETLNNQKAEIETSLSLARDVYERQSRLWGQKIGSEVQYLQAKNNVERLEKSLETLAHQMTKSNVYAPASGYVHMVFAKMGEMAGPGAPIIQILNTSRIKVVAEVPENYLTAIKKGAYVTLKFPALELEKRARVSLIGRTINPANRTFKVEVDVPNSKGVLKPNLLASMMINDYTEKNAIAVPLELVQQEVGGKDYVFVKKEGEDGPIASKVYVQTGESAEGNVIITEGLKGTEEIIIKGARGLSENELLEVMKVEPANEKTTTNG